MSEVTRLLAANRSEIVLTEETEDDGGRLRADYFWCVDPLDGTLPFIEGRPGSAVSIALIARDGTPVERIGLEGWLSGQRHLI